ncbi:helix-turn-helix domain-containing protein [Paraburkholderia xenovorans]
MLPQNTRLVTVHHPRYALLLAHLRELRLASGLTQAELAQRLQVDQSRVSKIERGERYVDTLLYLDWCRACDVDPSQAVAQLAEKGA